MLIRCQASVRRAFSVTHFSAFVKGFLQKKSKKFFPPLMRGKTCARGTRLHRGRINHAQRLDLCARRGRSARGADAVCASCLRARTFARTLLDCAHIHSRTLTHSRALLDRARAVLNRAYACMCAILDRARKACSFLIYARACTCPRVYKEGKNFQKRHPRPDLLGFSGLSTAPPLSREKKSPIRFWKNGGGYWEI